MSMLWSMINFNVSKLFPIELIFRRPQFSLSDDWAFISLRLDSESRAPVLGNEKGNLCKLLQLLKAVKIDLISTTALGRLLVISKFVAYSPESKDLLKTIIFAKKIAYLIYKILT